MTTLKISTIDMAGFIDYGGIGCGEWYLFASLLLICYIFFLVIINIMMANGPFIR